MSQSTKNVFDELSSKPGLSWADEMNELADTDDAGSLLTLPEWKPLTLLNQADDQSSKSAQGNASVISFDDLLEASDTNNQEYSDRNPSSSHEAESGSSENCESSDSGDDGDPTSEDETEHQSENEQQEILSSMSTRADSEFESAPDSSEQEDETSSASGDDDDHSFSPYHPGWTMQLSPSISPLHSTPPEVNKWAFSPPIGWSLQKDLDLLRLDEDCPNLVKPITVSCALMHTDNDAFEGYAFPYGARGLKRPLPKLFHRKRPEARQRSQLSHIEVVEYSQEDLDIIDAKAASHFKKHGMKEDPESIEIELRVSPKSSSASSSASDPDFLEHSAQQSEREDDLWSPLTDEEDIHSHKAAEENECFKFKERPRKWSSASEPNLSICDIFDLEDHQRSHARSANVIARTRDAVAYLDLALASVASREWVDKEQDFEELPILDDDTTLGATTAPTFETLSLSPNISTDVPDVLSFRRSQNSGSLSGTEISFVASTTDKSSDRTVEPDTSIEILNIAIATALPDVGCVEDLRESKNQGTHPFARLEDIQEALQEDDQHVEEKICRYEGASLGVFGGILAAGRFLWDCLNDKPLVLDNPW